MIKAILFDLDGTLIPIPGDTWDNVIFQDYKRVGTKNGFDGTQFLAAILSGYKAALQSTGEETIFQVYDKGFRKVLDHDFHQVEQMLEEYYRGKFNEVKNHMILNLDLKENFKKLKEQGLKLVLATNPMMPLCSVESRLNWVNLTASDFDLITHYKNTQCGKSHLAYWNHVLAAIGVQPNEALMVGNSTKEDAKAADAGCPVILLTDCLKNEGSADLSQFTCYSITDFFQSVSSIINAY